MSWLNRLLSRKSSPSQTIETEDSSVPPSNLVVVTGDTLITNYLIIVNRLYSSVPVSREYFDKHYRSALVNAAAYMQAFPASQNHHHCKPYGLIQHSLEISLFASRLSKKFIYIDKHESSIAELEDRFQFACFSAALFHDIGKVCTDIEVIYKPSKEDDWVIWNPTSGPMPISSEYKYIYVEGSNYKAHNCMATHLAISCLSNESKQWLFSCRKLYSDWLLALSGQYEEAGEVGMAISQADKFSVKNALNSEPAIAKPKKNMDILSKISHSIRHADALNKAGNAFYVTSKHVFLIHPKWCDGVLLDDAKPARTAQNTILNILGEDDGTVKTEGAKTLSKLCFNMRSSRNGNLTDSILSVVILRREAVDPDNSLPVCKLTIRNMAETPLPEELEYLTENQTTNVNTESQQVTDPTETEDTASRDNFQVEQSHSRDRENINRTINSCDGYDEQDPSIEISAEEHLYQEYIQYRDEQSCNTIETNNSKKHDTIDNLGSCQLTNIDIDPISQNTEKQNVDEQFAYSDKTCEQFVNWLTEISTDIRNCNHSTALIHKINDEIFVIWPEGCTRFWVENKSSLKEKFKGLPNRNRSLERHLTNGNFVAKKTGNESFWRIQFRAKDTSNYGVPIGCIKLNNNLATLKSFKSLINNKSARVFS